MRDEDIISIKIMDRAYTVKCPASEATDLHEAAKYVDDQMRKVRQAHAVTSTDRIAVVAALNICQELLKLKKQYNQNVDMVDQRIRGLQSRIEEFLEESEEVFA